MVILATRGWFYGGWVVLRCFWLLWWLEWLERGKEFIVWGAGGLCFEVILNCYDDGDGWKRDYQKRERMNGLGGRRVRVVLGDNYGTTSPPMGTHRTLVSPQIWFSNFLKIQNWANLPLALSLKENPFLNATYKVETELMWNVQVFFLCILVGVSSVKENREISQCASH